MEQETAPKAWRLQPIMETTSSKVTVTAKSEAEWLPLHPSIRASTFAPLIQTA